jgi:hypothetical protein
LLARPMGGRVALSRFSGQGIAGSPLP